MDLAGDSFFLKICVSEYVLILLSYLLIVSRDLESSVEKYFLSELLLLLSLAAIRKFLMSGPLFVT